MIETIVTVNIIFSVILKNIFSATLFLYWVLLSFIIKQDIDLVLLFIPHYYYYYYYYIYICVCVCVFQLVCMNLYCLKKCVSVYIIVCVCVSVWVTVFPFMHGWRFANVTACGGACMCWQNITTIIGVCVCVCVCVCPHPSTYPHTIFISVTIDIETAFSPYI